jgi:hypothetical protein
MARHLSTNFTFEELTTTTIGDLLDTNRVIGEQEPILSHLTWVATNLLEPIRLLFPGRKIFISSGYRCPQLNKRIGGSPTSQHVYGDAVDFNIERYDTPELRHEAILAIMKWGWDGSNQPKFRQLLEERGCIHISRPNGNHDGEVAFAEYINGAWQKKIIQAGVDNG